LGHPVYAYWGIGKCVVFSRIASVIQVSLPSYDLAALRRRNGVDLVSGREASRLWQNIGQGCSTSERLMLSITPACFLLAFCALLALFCLSVLSCTA